MKSSAPDHSFAGFLQRALGAIRAEVPWAHEELARALGAWKTTLIVDGEPATVHAGGPGGIAIVPSRGACDVVCTTTSPVILNLIGGRDTLLDAVEADRIELIGGVDALMAWHRMLELFLHGAVRARAFDGLLSDFRGRVRDLQGGA